MQGSNTHILIVDDEPKIVRVLQSVFRVAGFRVSSISSGAEAVERVPLEQPDLIILDIMLVGNIDGYETARRIREYSDVPIIMLTAKVRESDLLQGFDAGADDYVTKPFSTKELLARVRAVLKRPRQGTTPAYEPYIDCGPLRVDRARRTVAVKGQPVRLTRTEYNLIHELAIHRNEVLLHEDLLMAVWGAEYRDDVGFLRTYIYQLRQKIEPDPANPQIIVTWQGAGYILVCPD